MFRVGDIVRGRRVTSTMHRVLKIHDDGTLDVICIVGSSVGRRKHITRPSGFVAVDLSEADIWMDIAHSYAIVHDVDGYLGTPCNCTTCKRYRTLTAEREKDMGRLRNGQGLPDDDTIRELARTHRQTDIAQMYGVTRGAVHHRFNKLGLTKQQERPASVGADDVYAKIIAYKKTHDGGTPTLEWIAKKLKISVNKVWRMIHVLEQQRKVKRVGRRDLLVIGARWVPPPGPIAMPVWGYDEAYEPDADFSYWRFSANLANYLAEHIDLEDGNYTVEAMLREAGVIKPDMTTDTEFSCMYLDFPSEESAKQFIDDLNTFCAPYRKDGPGRATGAGVVE